MENETPQPGATFKPGGQTEPEKPAPEPEQARPERPQIESPPAPEEPAQEQPKVQPGADGEISWTASEFVAHSKTAGWYTMVTLGLLVVAGGIYFLTKDVISTGVIGFAGLLFMILGSHKPRQLTYKVDGSGISIGQKFYPFTEFKSFGVHQEGVIGSINLLPLKRFMPELSIYYPPEHENEIVDILVEHLPHEQREEHHVDRLLKKIRF